MHTAFKKAIQRCLLLLGIFVLLAACSGGGDGAGDETNAGNGGDSDDGSMPDQEQTNQQGSDSNSDADANTTLEGSWRSACLFDGGALPFRQMTFSLTENIFTFDIGLFVDSACQDAAQDTFISGTHNAPSAVSVNVEQALVLDIVQVQITPLLSPVADSFNTASLCGIADWVPEVPLDVSGCTDRMGLLAPRQLATVFLIDDAGTTDSTIDDILFLGDIQSERTSVLNTEVAFLLVQR